MYLFLMHNLNAWLYYFMDYVYQNMPGLRHNT